MNDLYMSFLIFVKCNMRGLYVLYCPCPLMRLIHENASSQVEIRAVELKDE